MTKTPATKRLHTSILWTMLLFYLTGRLCQLYADKLPSLLIVILHVAPPAIFALVHGAILYRLKGILTFAALCLGVGAIFESLSLRTGFPFGHYFFTNVMGPKLFQLPILLVLAYLGIGYASWILALIILGYRNKPFVGVRIVALPLLASFIMLAWDLSMEADWSTLDRAWIWQDGGAYFGVPISNFFGWYLTAFTIYQLFALYLSARPAPPRPLPGIYWRTTILLYTICAAGNLLLLRMPMAPPLVADPTGKQWLTHDILAADALISLLVMGPMTLLAWLRLKELESEK